MISLNFKYKSISGHIVILKLQCTIRYVHVSALSMFKKATAVLTTYTGNISSLFLKIRKECLILTSLKVLIDNSTMFPAVSLVDELDIAMIRMQQSFFLPNNRYQSIMYAVSPTLLHCHAIYFHLFFTTEY